MSKNRNYRDYSSYKKQEEVVEPVVEESVDLQDTSEDPKSIEDAEVKEESSALEANVLAEEFPVGKISCEKLRVRTSPEVKPNNIMGVFPKGTEVTILKDGGDWLTVEISKNSVKSRGFVMSKFIER